MLNQFLLLLRSFRHHFQLVKPLVCAVSLITFFSGLTHAQQISFKKTVTKDEIHFQYQWTDSNNALQNLEFSLPPNIRSSIPTAHPNYNPNIAQRHVIVALLKEAQKIDPKKAKIEIKTDNQRININVKSSDPNAANDILASLQEIQQNAFDQYLQKHHYIEFTTMFNQHAIKPDHLRYVKETTEALIPVSQAFYEKIKSNEDARAYFNLLLGWVQSIPYNALEDRVSSSGSGFSPPLGVIMQNIGDCDSKAVLTSALVRAFLPTTKMVIVFLPDHALLGVALTPNAQDETIKVDGETYVLYDPTGPALLPFGKISEQTQTYIATGRYQVEQIE